ncbi:MAG TPA: TIGR03435 family protein [Bryobacteraceae bacterium]|jgi:uncharacterized protein (TIGR03435 family)
MFRCLPLIAAALCAAGSAAPQAAFEVASIKKGVEPERTPMICLVPCTPGERLTVQGSRVDIRYMSIEKLIVTAYGVKAYQLSGPEWMRSERFDIQAKIPDGVSKDRVPEMLRALLAERFKLAIHRDTKELPVYALVVGKNGSKLEKAAADANAPPPEAPGSQPLYSPQGEARMLDGGRLFVSGGSLGSIRGGRAANGAFGMEFLNISMPGLAEVLTPHLERPVVDMTGLKGEYRFAWENRPPADGGGGGRKGGVRVAEPGRGGDAPEAGPRPDPFGEALFAALDKSGLKLEARKAPVETLVVDHVERIPTEN